MYHENIQHSLTERLSNFTNDFFTNNRVQVISKYKEEIAQVTALEAIRIFNSLALRNDAFDDIKINIDKFTSIFYFPLKGKYPPKKLPAFYSNLHAGNSHLLKTIEQYRPLLKRFLNNSTNETSGFTSELLNVLNLIKQHNITFRKEKQTLFVLLEKVLPAYKQYFNIERLFQNDLNYMLIQCEHLLRQNEVDRISLNRLIGKLYFRIHLSIYREQLMLFPLGQQFIHEKIIIHSGKDPQVISKHSYGTQYA
jgi:DUF438 domain-containing protein